MGKIDTSEWKEFSVCELFGKSKLGRYHSPESLVESETGYPYICASNQNNGVNQKMSLVSGDDVRPTPQNIISWGKQCPYFTFHEEPCVTGQGMYYIVVPKYIPRRAIRYVITVLQSAVEGKFGYSDCFIGSSMDDLSIKLPTTPDGDPDWAYMESYMANLETKVAESLTLLHAAKDAEKKKVDTREWGEFRVEELFDAFLSKDDIQPKSITEGATPLVSSGKEHNGIVAYIEEPKAHLWEGNTLTVDMFGKVFFHEQPYFAVSHGRVNILKAKSTVSSGALQFVGCAIEKVTSKKYEFSEMCTGTKLLKDAIMLPVNKNGDPDWDYMEEYMKMVQEKTERVLNQFISV